MLQNQLKKLLLNFCRTEGDQFALRITLTAALVALTGLFDYLTDYETRTASIYVVLTTIMAIISPVRVRTFFLSIILLLRFWFIEHEAPQDNNELMLAHTNFMIQVVAILISFTVASTLKTLVIEAIANAQNDPLTELFTRKYVHDVMPIIMSELRRHQRPMSIMFIDCDNFKEVNDTYGHSAGDAVLRVVAKTLLGTIREGDIPVRLGGDEFVVIFPEASGDQLKAVVERCIGSLNEEMASKAYPITFSVGVVEFLSIPKSIEDAISAADRVMYHAKKTGKNRVIYEDWPGF